MVQGGAEEFATQNKGKIFVHVCACGEVTWRLMAGDVGGSMELLLEMTGGCWDEGGRVLSLRF